MDSERTPLLTDLYELNMLQTYLESGMTDVAVFEFFLRPAGDLRPFFVAAGAETAVDWLEQLAFTADELDWIHRSGYFSHDFASTLEGWRFTGEATAMPEGSICFANEPIFQVIAPLPEAQLAESRLMNILHGQTLFASKAIRSRLAAGNARLVDFGMRRAHGAEAALWAARSCYLAGFDATATCLADERFDVPLSGTMAHSFILAHDDEEEAFERYARSHPDNVVLLIDTYDVEAGARKVVNLAHRLSGEGIRIQGVRIDSGDLGDHARKVRGILDEAGCRDIAVLVSGGLDEHAIAEFVSSGAPIDGFGVGSKVNTSADSAFLDSAYKLHAYAGQPRGKRSEGKHDLPGRKQVVRTYDEGVMQGDIIALHDERHEGTPLLTPVMRNGRRHGERQSLEAARERCRREVASLPAGLRRLTEASAYPVKLSPRLRKLTEALRTG